MASVDVKWLSLCPAEKCKLQVCLTQNFQTHNLWTCNFRAKKFKITSPQSCFTLKLNLCTKINAFKSSLRQSSMRRHITWSFGRAWDCKHEVCLRYFQVHVGWVCHMRWVCDCKWERVILGVTSAALWPLDSHGTRFKSSQRQIQLEIRIQENWYILSSGEHLF